LEVRYFFDLLGGGSELEENMEVSKEEDQNFEIGR
jgi:hypothetical protein